MRLKQPTRYVNPVEEFFYFRHENANTLKEVWNCAYATARKKIKEPRLLTVGDLLDVETCGIATLDEMLAAIKEAKK